MAIYFGVSDTAIAAVVSVITVKATAAATAAVAAGGKTAAGASSFLSLIQAKAVIDKLKMIESFVEIISRPRVSSWEAMNKYANDIGTDFLNPYVVVIFISESDLRQMGIE